MPGTPGEPEMAVAVGHQKSHDLAGVEKPSPVSWRAKNLMTAVMRGAGSVDAAVSCSTRVAENSTASPGVRGNGRGPARPRNQSDMSGEWATASNRRSWISPAQSLCQEIRSPAA